MCAYALPALATQEECTHFTPFRAHVKYQEWESSKHDLVLAMASNVKGIEGFGSLRAGSLTYVMAKIRFFVMVGRVPSETAAICKEGARFFHE